jgi:hypothetical protein
MRFGRKLRTLGIAAMMAAALPAAPSGAGHNPDDYFDLDVLPEPGVTGAQIFQGLQQFVDDYPYRLTGGPTEILAAQALRDEMDALGYEADIEPLGLDALGLGDDTPEVGLKAVTAMKRGTTRPDDWIMFVGHYDTVPQTIYGAYDNGAGTNLMRYLAKALADVPTNRSIVFVWYNAEEQGLRASNAHAAALAAADQEITAVLGFDMVGIAWPVANPTSSHCLCMWHGPGNGPAFVPLLRHVNYDFLEYPEGLTSVRIVGQNTRNSDEQSFASRGYPTLRWAGMRTAASYPAYHEPEDTIETILDTAGGQSYYEQGVENTLTSAYYSALLLDNHPPVPDFQVSADGLTATFDASLTTDQDGTPAGFAWDFGDGTTGEGEQVTHTYDEPGAYAVTLTVTDNLWTDVTRSVTLGAFIG